MIVQPRVAPSGADPARSPQSVIAAIQRSRGVSAPKPAQASPAVGSPQPRTPSQGAIRPSVGSQVTQTASQEPPVQPDQAPNRGLVPEGVQPEAAPQLAPAEGDAQKEHGEGEPPPQGQTSKTQRKWKALLKQKAEANAEVAQLKAELQAVKALVQAGHQQAPAAQAQPAKRGPPEFGEPFPKDGTDREQLLWEARKAAHDQAHRIYTEQLPQQLGESFRNFATVIEPALQHSLAGIVEQQWSGLSDTLDSLGIGPEDRPALRELVEAEAANMGTDIPSALGRVLFHKNFSGHWQEDAAQAAPAAASASPASRSPARPAGPARATTGRFQATPGADPVEEARELKKSGNKFQAEARMAAYLKTLTRAR